LTERATARGTFRFGDLVANIALRAIFSPIRFVGTTRRFRHLQFQPLPLRRQ
jgi:hypothetical protein